MPGMSKSPAAGWYPDQQSPDVERWWDGSNWTPRTRPGPAKGVNGQLTFDGGIVHITRGGLAARATVGKGDKRIPVRSITAVQWKPAGIATNGFIQFTVPGGNEVRSRFGRQQRDAAYDENTVTFTRRHQAEFEGLRNAIEAAMGEIHRPPPQPLVEVPPAPPSVPAGAPPAQWIGNAWRAWNAGADRWMIWDGQTWR